MPIKISRILHAGYIFEHNKTQIAFDPIFENRFSINCHAFPSVEFDYSKIKNLNFDAVFISHYHDDHCSLESLNYLNRSTPIYIFCIHKEIVDLIRQLGFLNVYSLDLNLPIQIKSFTVIPRMALDADVDSIFHISVDNLNILNVVDSWINPHTLSQYLQNIKWDMILWPFQTMRELEVLAPTRISHLDPELPIEWIEQLKILKPKFIVPSSCQFKLESWSWYNDKFFPISYQFFTKNINSILPQTKVLRLNPSVSLFLNAHGIKTTESLNWLTPTNDQNLDYEFNKNSTISTTAEIAKKLTALQDLQYEQVLNYCKKTLINNYPHLEVTDSSYFNQVRLWQLSIYDHRGEHTNFYYQIYNSSSERLETANSDISWTPSTPLFRTV